MPRIAIVYTTKEGQTQKITERIASTLAESGCRVETHRVDGVPDGFALDGFDGCIVGGSVHAGEHQAALRKFVETHRAALDAMPTAFFSVSLSEAGTKPEQHADAVRMAEHFQEETGWTPGRVETFAGALTYTQYNFILRWMMKRIASKAGGDTNTSRDYEYTDWGKVDAFAREFAERLAKP